MFTPNGVCFDLARLKVLSTPDAEADNLCKGVNKPVPNQGKQDATSHYLPFMTDRGGTGGLSDVTLDTSKRHRTSYRFEKKELSPMGALLSLWLPLQNEMNEKQLVMCTFDSTQ